MKPNTLITLFLLVLTTTAFSQNRYNLKGTLVDIDGKSILNVEIFLNSESGTVIKSEIVTEGTFSFQSVPAGSYTLQVVNSGYEDLFLAVQLSKDEILKLTLVKASDYMLNEVVVSSGKKTFINNNGNIKINVKNSIFEAVPNSVDLLQKLPGIQVSPDKENISVIGRGDALIYIDKQKATVNDVNALAVADIKSIEIIKNPSSKYEAQGRAVILITRVKNSREGFEVGIAETVSFKKRFNNYFGVNPSFKSGSFEVRGNINYNYLNPWERISNDLEIPQEQLVSNFDANAFTRRDQVLFGAGLYYGLNEDDYLSLNINGRIQKDHDKNTTNTYMQDAGIVNNVVTLNNNDEDRNFINSSLNYNKKIKSLDANIFAGLQYSKYSQESNSVINNNYNATDFELEQVRDQDFDVEVVTGRLDFEKKLSEGINIEAGLLHLSANATTDFNITDFVSDGSVASVYLFKENNTAAYTQASGKIARVSYLVGLRAENTDINGQFKDDAIPVVDKNYTNFFPKAQISFPLDSLKSISLNYAKSIARPNYSSTSQISIYTNPYVLFSRNLNLDPTITDEVSAGFQFKDKSVSLTFFHSKNPIYFGYVYNPSTNIINFSSMNYEQEQGFNLEFTAPFTYKIWSSSNTVSLILDDIKDPNAVVNDAKPYLYYYTNHMFKLPKGYTVMAGAWGYTERNSGAFMKNPIFTMDLGATKTFFERLDVTLSCNDIFRGLTFKEDISVNGISSKGVYYVDGREFAVTLRYTFGKLKESSFKEKKVNENSNRIN